MKKIVKLVAIIAAIAAALAGIYVIVKKLAEKKNATSDEENYVSCSCEKEFASETVG